MRTLPTLVVAIVLGCAIGGALAYVNVGPNVPLDRVISTANSGVGGDTAADFPQVEAEEITYNFGTMQKGTTKSHVFKFTNRGAAPLTLTVGTTSCRCTMVDLSDKEEKLAAGQFAADKPIPPGGTVGVKLKWTASVPAGPFRQTAQLRTNDPRLPQVELSVEGDVTEVTGLNPGAFTFDKIRAGEVKTASVQLVAFGDEPLKISDSFIKPAEQKDYFDIKVVPLNAEELAEAKAKTGVKVELTNKPNLPLGLLTQAAVVKTNMPDWEELEIGIHGRVVGDITLHGRGWREEVGALQLGVIDSKQGGEVKLLISTKGEHADDIQLEVAEVDPPELQVTLGKPKVIQPGERSHTDFSLKFPPGMAPMIRLGTEEGPEGKIVIKTNHPVNSELIIPVRFAVKR